MILLIPLSYYLQSYLQCRVLKSHLFSSIDGEITWLRHPMSSIKSSYSSDSWQPPSKKAVRLGKWHFTTMRPFQNFPYSAPGIASARLGRSNYLTPKRSSSTGICLKNTIFLSLSRLTHDTSFLSTSCVSQFNFDSGYWSNIFFSPFPVSYSPRLVSRYLRLSTIQASKAFKISAFLSSIQSCPWCP
jgi:hypothetical protein